MIADNPPRHLIGLSEATMHWLADNLVEMIEDNGGKESKDLREDVFNIERVRTRFDRVG